jgi:glycosyltransferase involved in cell wall biosynthesis
MKTRPVLSIGIPVYNGGEFLDELLTNLQGQTFEDFEIIICDNASTDGTREICEAHAREDSRIRYYRNDINLGAHANYNKVFSLSRTALFKFAACDDLLEPTYLEKCVQILNENPDVIGAHSFPLYVNAQCRPFTFDAITNIYTDPSTGARLAVDPAAGGESRFALIRFASTLFNPGVCLRNFGVFRRSALERSRLYRPSVPAADKAILLEMALLGRFVHVKEKLFIRRFHPGESASLSEEEIMEWIDPKGVKYFWRLRTFLVFLSTPIGKPIDMLTKLTCFAIVCAYGLKYVPIIALRSIGLLRTPDEVRPASRTSRIERTLA